MPTVMLFQGWGAKGRVLVASMVPAAWRAAKPVTAASCLAAHCSVACHLSWRPHHGHG